MTPEAIPAAVIFGIAFFLGARSTRRLWQRYNRIAPLLAPNRRLLGRSFVIVSVAVITAVGWLGFLAVRRLLGFEALDWSSLVSYLLAIPVLLIPPFLEWVWDRVGSPVSVPSPAAVAEPPSSKE